MNVGDDGAVHVHLHVHVDDDVDEMATARIAPSFPGFPAEPDRRTIPPMEAAPQTARSRRIVVLTISLVVAGLLLVAVPMTASRLAASRIEAAAARAGFRAVVGASWGGPDGSVHFADIALVAPEGIGATARVRNVTLSGVLGVLLGGEAEVEVEGVFIAIEECPSDPSGIPDDVKRRLERVRSAASPAASSGRSARPVHVTFRELDVECTAGGRPVRPIATGLSGSLERDGQGSLQATVDGRVDLLLGGPALAQAAPSVPGLGGDGIPALGLPGGHAVSFRGMKIRDLRTIQFEGVELREASLRGFVVSGTIDRLTLRAREGSLPRSRRDLAEITITGGRLEVLTRPGIVDPDVLLARLGLGGSQDVPAKKTKDKGKGTNRKAKSDSPPTPAPAPVPVPVPVPEPAPDMAATSTPRLPTTYVVEGTSVRLSDPARPDLAVTLADVSARIVSTDSGKDGTLSASVILAGTAPFHVEAKAEGASTRHLPASLDVRATGVPAALLARISHKAWIRSGTIDASVRWSRPQPGSRQSATASVALNDLALQHRRLGPDPVVLDGWTASAQGWYDPATHAAHADVTLGAPGGANARVELDRKARKARRLYDVRFILPEQDCATFPAALPAALVADLAGMTMEGVAQGRLSVLDLDPKNPWGLRLEVDGSLDRCRINSLGPVFDARMALLKTKFVLPVDEGDGPLQGVEIGPGTRGWIPFDEMPEVLQHGPLWSEDGDFYRHKGFHWKHIEGALRSDLADGTITRGGSSISQQLAKNLFTGRGKDFGRKLEETLVVVALERNLTKNRILELYLNCIEYGVKLYGIGPASLYYFAKKPADLSPPEIAFLMHLKPWPKAAWAQARKGVLPQGWRAGVEKRLNDMVRLGYLTQAEKDAMAPYDPIEARTGGKPLPEPARGR